MIMWARFVSGIPHIYEHVKRYHFTHEGRVSEQFYTIHPVINPPNANNFYGLFTTTYFKQDES